MPDINELQAILSDAKQLYRSAQNAQQRQRATRALEWVDQQFSQMEAERRQSAQLAPGEVVGVNPEAAERLRARELRRIERANRGEPLNVGQQQYLEGIGATEEIALTPAQRAAANLFQGYTLGLSDDLYRGMGQVAGLVSPEAQESLTRTANEMEAAETRARATHPVESLVTQLGAGLVNPIGWYTGAAANTMRSAPTALGVLGLGGLTEGVAEAVGRDMGLGEGLLSTAVNTAAPMALGALGDIGRGTKEVLAPDAGGRIMNLMEEADVTPQQLQALQGPQPETIPELAARQAGVMNIQETPLGSAARAMATRPGEGRQIVAENLASRAEDAQNRVESVIDQALGGRRLQINREAANAAYQTFRDTPWPEQTPESLRLFVKEEPEIEAVIKDAQRTFRSENRELWNSLPKKERMWNWQTMDNIKKALDSKASVALRKGNLQKARDLRLIKNDFLKEVEAINPNYAPARAIYADGAAKEQAQEMGRSYFKQARRDTDIEKDFAKLPEAEKQQFRIGALDELLMQIEGVPGDNPDFARKLIGKDSVRKRLRAISDNPDQVEAMIDRLVVESRATQAARQILGGSPTAARTAEIDDEAVVNLLQSMGNLRLGDVGAEIGRRVLAADPLRQTANRDIATMLSASNPEQVREMLSALAAREPSRPRGRIYSSATRGTPPVGLLFTDEQE